MSDYGEYPEDSLEYFIWCRCEADNKRVKEIMERISRTPQLEPISKDKFIEIFTKEFNEYIAYQMWGIFSKHFGQPKVSEEEIEGIMESVYIELCLEKEDIFMTKPQVKRVAKAITNKLNRGE